FNTGQVILGWCRAYTETKDERYLAAAKRAGDWLLKVQFPDGSWRLNGPEAETMVHAYDVRTAWSLLELDSLLKDGRYTRSATFNLDWTLAQQQENGWFRHNAFFTADKWKLPLTHTISYVLEGLVEAERLLGGRQYLNAAGKTAWRLLEIFETQNYMPGEFDGSWQSPARYSCLTGNAQIAGVWLRFYQLSREPRFLNGAVKLNDTVKATQRLRSLHLGVRGGVKGSQPISGRYTPYTYINWGAKFLADSLMLEEKVLAEKDQAPRETRVVANEPVRRQSVQAINQ
ncbi:MAG TPA: pectate lyase, partial [Blastocatellia bacterium]|nr:pectate lyase [Blastocatellia bacterium]